MDALNPSFSSVGGVLFDKSQTTLIQYPGARAGAYTIPSSVTSIADYAFRYCASLTDVTMGNSVTSIGYEAFNSCTSLTNVTIPDSVTSIEQGAFLNCTNLTSVIIGNGVTSIGVNTFYSCTSLTRVAIPDSVTSIGDGAFYSCTSLTNVTIPNTVITIESWAFADTGLTSVAIPDSVTSIGNRAFYGCANLTSVTIPDSVTSIGDCAFSYCTSLTQISVDALNPSFSSVDGVLFDKGRITLIQYPGGNAGAYTIPSSVTTIADYAFRYCASLTDVTMGNNVTSIGYEAFDSCTSLTNVTVGTNVTSIRDYAFSSCTKLTSVSIPVSVTNIGRGAFASCTSLTSVTIPNSVTNIAYDVFSSCTSLTSVTIPNSVTSIGDGAFSSCRSLTNVTIGTNVTWIGYYAFSQCTNLTSVTIPDSVIGIGPAAFSSCSSLTSAAIGNHVSSIREYVFYSCTRLANVTIGANVTSIGDCAFASCPSLTGVYFKGNAPSVGWHVFEGDTNATVYYRRGTTGWGTTFASRPTALWNLVPVADATATGTWFVSANGANGTAILDGSRSYDPEGDALQYFWFFSPGSQAPTLLATGVVAVVVLPLGSHPIDLVVSDAVATSTNSVTVSVVTTGQAVQWLIAMVEGSGVRNPKPLTATLRAAQASIERGNPVSATNQLQAFQNKVRAQVADPALARQFIEAAQQAIGALGSSGLGHSGRVRLLARPGAKGRFSFTGAAYRLHVVEASTNLADWERIGVAVDHGDGRFTFEDANAGRCPNRFYRVVSP